MPIQKMIDYLGIARQTSGKGTPATTAVYGLGLLGGSSFAMPIDQEKEAQTLSGGVGDRAAVGVNRLAAHPGAAPRFRAYQRSLPMFLRAALGTLVTSGAGPFTHTLTSAQLLDYWTLFGRKGSDHERVTDAVCEELKMSWTERGPLECEATFMGANYVMGAASPTVTNDEVGQEYWGPISGTLQYDVNSGTPVTGKVTGFEVTIKNNLEEIPVSSALTPDDLFPGEQAVSGVIKVKPDNLNDWRAILTGTDAGTVVSVDPIYGSFSMLVTDGTNTLTNSATRAAFMTEFPEADPAGGAVELDLAFDCVRPTAGGTMFTAAVVNQTTSYA
jgi:hypothetical protein